MMSAVVAQSVDCRRHCSPALYFRKNGAAEGSMNVVNRELVRSEPIWEQVVAVLRLEIVVGELPHGAHLKEPLLARRFGVSRLPIREAIAQLDRERLVRILPRR